MKRKFSEGFALPTVVITSVVMFAVLAAAVGVVSSTRASLDVQFYEGIASDAAESGTTQANSCLADNNYVSLWGTASLHPGTGCYGGGDCTNVPTCFVLQDKPDPINQPNYVDYRSTYTVAPAQSAGNGIQIITATGTVQLLRANGQVWDTYTKVLNIKVGAQIASAQIAMGYASGQGAYYATVGRDGKMRAAGYNGYAQLGNGTWTDTLTPTAFTIPSTNPIVAAYTNYFSLGRWTFAVDNTGTAYGAGFTQYGQLGIGISGGTWSVSVPTKVVLPVPGVGVRSIVTGAANSYFLGTDNNIYVAGGCADGMLGTNYTIAGCSDQTTPVRVNLPTPNLSNPNTIPSDNIVTDRSNVYVRMQGGAVYGWGDNYLGELGNANFYVQSSNPTKMGTYGDAGQAAATQIATDGSGLNVLDNNGNVKSIGSNLYGQFGNREAMLYFGGNCLENTNSNGVTVGISTCTGAPNQLFQLRADGTLYNAAKNVCLSTPDALTLNLMACSTSTTQKFTFDISTIRFTNTYSGRCLEYNGSTAKLNTCDGSNNNQKFSLPNSNFTPFNLNANITKIWTDQFSLSVLTDTGQVWSAGINESGQFGNGTSGYWYPDPVKFQSSVVMTDIFETNSGSNYENLYAIGNDGRVYGAGSNVFGQLGNGSMNVAVQSTPVFMNVINGTTIRALSVQAGYGTAVIKTTAGSVYTVGNNGNGQLGDGTTNNSANPIFSKYINPQGALAY